MLLSPLSFPGLPQADVSRFVHVSSVAVYGNLKQLPANEKTPCKPQSVYGDTKLAGEAAVRKFWEETGFPVVIIRPAWVYGAYCPRTLKIYRALRKGRFVTIGNGENLRHPLYIADMIEALRLAMEAESAVGELFIILEPCLQHSFITVANPFLPGEGGVHENNVWFSFSGMKVGRIFYFNSHLFN